MTNDKNFFSNELDDLFEEVSLDEASILAGGEIQPTQEEYEKELINKLNNNEIELTGAVIDEVRKVIKEGGDVDKRITEFLRQKFDIAEEEVQEAIAQQDAEEPNLFKEEVIETPQEVVDHIQDLANQLGGYVKKNNLDQKSEPEVADALTEKVDYLTNQLNIIRQTLDEQGQTIVAGIGQGGDGQTPGSGEVRLQKQDDVIMDGIKEGQTLCWDPDLFSGTGGWYPCDGSGGGGGGTIQPAIQGAVWGCKKVKDCADLYWGTKAEYEAWYNDGNLSDISTSTATKVVEDIKAINGCISLEYQPSASTPGASTSDKWYAVGAVDCDDNIIDTEDIFTPGDSSVFGPEGYFLVYDDPSDCSQSGEGCDPVNVEPIGCDPVLAPAGDFTNELRWGTQDDYDNWDPDESEADRIDIPVLDSSDSPITDVTGITAVVFEGCDKTTMEGKYTVYYRTGAGSTSKFATIYDDTAGVDERSFFIANAECDTTVVPDPPQKPVPGCFAASGCKEVSEKDEFDNDNFVGNLYWGNGVVADSEVVTDESGAAITDCKKLVWVASSPDHKYEVDPATGEIDGVWLLTYQDFGGNAKQVEWEGVIDPSTCEIGFFIDSPNACLNPNDTPDPPGVTRPWPGIITGCKEADPNEVSTGDLYWGSEQDVIDGTGTPAQDGPASTGTPITDCQKIVYVFSTDPAVDETNKIGIWGCIYKNFAGEYQVGWSPSSINDGENEGFYINVAPDACLDDDPDVDIKWGILTGCREPVTASQLYWGKRTDYVAGTPGEEVSNHRGNLADEVKRVYRPFSDDGETWLGIYLDGTPGFVGQVRLAVHPQDGTARNSPMEGFYLLGPCLVDDSDESCPLDDTVYAEPVGCREVEDPGTDLLWGQVGFIDIGFAGAEVVDTEVTKILQVYTNDLCDNGFGVWEVLYTKLVAGKEEVRQAVREGYNPAAVEDESETFYLDTDKVPCLEDPDDIDGGKPTLGLITGCRRTLEITGTTLHWGDGSTSKDVVKDVDGNDVVDAKFIVAVVSFNADEATNFGDWFCIFKRGDGSYGTAITYGQSPADGYYLDDANCDPDECEGKAYLGFLPDCNRVNEAFGAGDLYWNNGDDSVDNIDTGEKARRVIATLTVDDCSDDDFDITADHDWLALYKDESDKYRVYGDQLGKSPNGGYYIETDDVNSFCDYDTDGPGDICEGDDDCPLGFICVGGICEQMRCDTENDCPDGFDCVNGICLRPCGIDGESLCPPNFHCITIGDDEWCVPGKECNGECPEGYHCLDGECVILECILNPDPGDPTSGCPPGYECYNGQCLKPCDGTTPCPAGFQCVDGHCLPDFGPCPPNGCPAGYDCILGACRPACDGSNPCPDGYQCFNGHCFPECPPQGCPSGHKCIGGICFPDRDCEADGDCGGDFVCLNGICLPKCDGGGNCPPGFECFDGIACVPLCDPDNPCPEGFHCLGGRCVPTLSCDDDSNCPTGYSCIDGFCRKDCDDSAPDPGCPPGFECFDLGDGTTHCFPKCDTDSCPPGHECIGGICIPPLNCNRPDACPPGWDCAPEGICRPPCDPGDGTDQCPGLGLECIDGHCWTACDPDNPCPDGFNCIDGKCIPDIKCDGNGDCPTGFDCIGGICREICADDADCPDGFSCYFGHCLPNCDETKDCPSGHACFDGTCVPIETCDEDSDCSAGYTCVDGECLKICTGDADCPPGTMCIDGKCEHIGGPDGNCKVNDECPDGFECVDGKCRKICDKPSACPPGYVCIEGNCLPGVPEGPCADGVCPPGYDCIMGICRKPCTITGDCDDGFECVFPPGGCFPQICDENNPCPDGFECFNGRCRQVCDIGNPCPEGYNCVEVGPGLTICLPITIDPEGPEQPTEDGPITHPNVGCEEVDKCGTLYWGSENDYSANGGELQQDENGPITLKKIERIEARNIYPNGFADYTVFYVPCDAPDEIHQYTVNKQSPVNGDVQSFFIRPDADATCIDFGDVHEPYPGAITGCKETDNGGTLHWGTLPEGLNDALPNEPLKYPDGSEIICKGIMDVFSINSEPPAADGSCWGTWIIAFNDLTGATKFVTKYGNSGPNGPEGAFMRASVGSRCIDNPQGITTTRDVLLVNSPRVMATRKRFFGDEPMSATTMEPQFNTPDVIGPGGEVIRYEVQEQSNLMNLNILDLLDQRKPTVHVIPDINDVVGRYIPQRGDLWIDPTDYSMYVCDHQKGLVTPDDEQDFVDDPAGNLVWIELGAASGGGSTPPTSDGSHIFLQGTEPAAAIVKHADIWIDDDTYLMYTYNETSKSWISLTGDVKAVLDNRFEVHISDTKPDVSTTRPGDLWFDSGNAEMRVAYVPDGSTSWVWVPVVGTGYKALPTTTAGAGADVGAAEVKELQDEIKTLSERLYYLERNLDQQQ